MIAEFAPLIFYPAFSSASLLGGMSLRSYSMPHVLSFATALPETDLHIFASAPKLQVLELVSRSAFASPPKPCVVAVSGCQGVQLFHPCCPLLTNSLHCLSHIVAAAAAAAANVICLCTTPCCDISVQRNSLHQPQRW